jgi:hypothetical protein
VDIRKLLRNRFFPGRQVGEALRRINLRPIGLLLVGVLLAHGLALSWLHDQLEDLKPLTLMADPLFTRMIMPSRTVAVPPSPRQRKSSKAVKATTADAPQQPAKAPDIEMDPDGQQAAPGEQASELTDAQADGQTANTAQAEPDQPIAVEAPAPPAPQEPPDTWPVDTRLTYVLKGYYRGDVDGNARVQWQREKNRYQVRVDLSLALLVNMSMTSQGEVTEAGLIPQAYQEELFGMVRRVAFESGQVKFNDGDLREAPEAVQDTASQLVELSHRFSTGREPLKVGAEVKIWLARPKGMDMWTYDVVGEEMLETPLYGTVQTFRLQPRPIAKPRGPIKAEIWFAPSLHYLPVRVRISGSGDKFMDLMVERIDQSAAPRPASPDVTSASAASPSAPQ